MTDEREAKRKALEEKWDREADLREQRRAEEHDLQRRHVEALERDVANRVEWRKESTAQNERQVVALEAIAKTFNQLAGRLLTEAGRDRA